jgi:uncharacterized protein
MRFPGGGRGAGLGCGGIVLLIVLALATGQDPLELLSAVGGGGGGAPGASIPNGRDTGPTAEPQDELGQFAAVVLADMEDTWTELFPQRLGQNYRLPRLVLFSNEVASACGYNTSAVGPFYCPADQKVYIDLAFFRELDRRFGAPGDFAQAYVIAHEVGHHVQNLLGISETVHRLQQQASQREGNELSVRLELQADCLAGVWANHAHRQRQLLEPGDVEEGLRAAGAIGDDQMQRHAGGRVRPESWTHGSSEQRMRWLRQGMETGDPDACDTFQTDRL